MIAILVNSTGKLVVQQMKVNPNNTSTFVFATQFLEPHFLIGFSEGSRVYKAIFLSTLSYSPLTDLVSSYNMYFLASGLVFDVNKWRDFLPYYTQSTKGIAYQLDLVDAAAVNAALVNVQSQLSIFETILNDISTRVNDCRSSLSSIDGKTP